MWRVLQLAFNADNPAADELDMQSVLQGAGFDVTLRSASDTEADETQYDAVVVGTRPGAAALETRYLGWRKLVVLVTQNEFNWKNHNFVDVNATVTVADSSILTITDAAHPLANGLAAGQHTIAGSSEGQAGAPANAFGAGVELVAARANTSNSYTLAAYRTGAVMANGATAAGHRVVIGWRTDLVQNWNATAKGLLVRAVLWGVQPSARLLGTGSMRATLVAVQHLAATATGAGSARAELRVGKPLAAHAAGASVARAALRVQKQLAATAAAASSARAELRVQKQLAAQLRADGAMHAELRVSKHLAARLTGVGTMRAALPTPVQPVTVPELNIVSARPPQLVAAAPAPRRIAAARPPVRS